jgi:hypothetical protein
MPALRRANLSATDFESIYESQNWQGHGRDRIAERYLRPLLRGKQSNIDETDSGLTALN